MANDEKASARARRRHHESPPEQSVTALDKVRAMASVPERSNGRDRVIGPSANEEQFAAIFASTTVGVAVLTPSTDFVQVNDAFCQVVGYSREELASLTCTSLTHPDDRPEMMDKIAALLAGEIPTFEIVKRYIRKDGAPIWVRNSVSLTTDAARKPLHLVALCQDITERRQSRLLLTEQNRLLELVASGHSLDECLAEVTRAMSRLQPNVRAAILLADDAGARLSTIIAVEFQPSFGGGLQDAPINDLAIGAFGAAVYSDQQIDSHDIANDERLPKEWRELCLAHGIRASHSEPVLGADNQPVASLMLCFDTPREPSEWELHITQVGAHIASVIVERRRAEAKLREREAELARELADMKQLQGISGQLIQEENPDDLYAKILDAAIAVMRSEMGSIQMLYPERNKLRLLVWKGFAPKAAAFWEWVRTDSACSCGLAFSTAERVIVEDVDTSDVIAGTADLDYYHLSDIRAVQSTPLISRTGRLLGMISTHWRVPHQPSERDLRLLDVLARQAADLIERKQAEEALRGSDERGAFLLALEDRLRGLADPREVKQVACDMLGAHLGVWRVVYGEVDPKNKDVLILENGWSDGTLPNLFGRFPFADIERQVAANVTIGADIEVEDFVVDKRRAEPGARAFLRKLGVRSGDSALIFKDGHLAGLMIVHSKTVRYWTREEHKLLREVARRTWEAVERARAEEALRVSEERYRTLFSLVPVAVYSCDADGAIREYNQSASELWGREPRRDDLGARYCGSYRLFYPDGRSMPREQCPMARALRGETLDGGRAEMIIERPDGSRRRVIASPETLVNERGVIIGAINCLFDITERTLLEEASAYFAAIVTSSYDAIISKTLDGVVTSWNASAEHMFGYTAEEMIGQPILRIIPPERVGEEDYILASIRAGNRLEHFETVRMTKDGRLLEVSLTISPIRDKSGKIIGASKIARDITEQKRLENALRVSERRMNDFLGIAAHELRTPLTSITANVQMALKQIRSLLQAAREEGAPSAENGNRPGQPQPLQRAALLLERTDRQILRLGRLVNDLVDVSRIQAGRLEMRLEPCDLLPIVRESVRDQSAAWPHRAISLTAQPNLVSCIMGDSDRVGQVVTNYLTNALKYSPDDTEVAVIVRAEERSGSLRVEVCDHGPGLTEEQREHLFERFYRAPGVEQQSGSGVGLGLGLHICKTIIGRHGGQVGVTSVPGEGSVFWFTLPKAMEYVE